LADIARRVSPLRGHASGDYPLLGSHSDGAVRAAMSSGHTDVVADSPLLVMLAAMRLGEGT
jgi:pyruvate, orthophosphate dikinase